jgi:hypothetical protein
MDARGIARTFSPTTLDHISYVYRQDLCVGKPTRPMRKPLRNDIMTLPVGEKAKIDIS